MSKIKRVTSRQIKNATEIPGAKFQEAEHCFSFLCHWQYSCEFEHSSEQYIIANEYYWSPFIWIPV